MNEGESMLQILELSIILLFGTFFSTIILLLHFIKKQKQSVLDLKEALKRINFLDNKLNTNQEYNDSSIAMLIEKVNKLLWTLEIIGPESQWTQCTIQKYSDTEGLGIPYTMKDFLILGIRLRSYFKIPQKLTDTWNKMVWVDVIPNLDRYFVDFIRQPYQDEVEAVKADPNYIENSFIIR